MQLFLTPVRGAVPIPEQRTSGTIASRSAPPFGLVRLRQAGACASDKRKPFADPRSTLAPFDQSTRSLTAKPKRAGWTTSSC